jgi:2,4-dichlorophenol 6-monooxygenase
MNPVASFGEIGLGTLRAIKPWTEWIVGWGFDISAADPNLTHEHLTEQIRTLIGDPNVDIEIKNASTWYVNQASATEYSVGRVFCGGDAVHRHPPSSGLGMNTCIQDSFNLAWKIAYVIKGYADPALLDSYSLERVPVGQQIVARANQSRKDYALIQECFRAEGAEDPTAAGLAKLRSATEEGVIVRQAVQEALHVKNYEFNAHGVELNQRYSSGAIVPDRTASIEEWPRDKQLYLQATTRPGAKLPHAWLVDKQGMRISTLDVTGKGKFSLLTGLAGEAWAKAARQLDLEYMRTVIVGAKGAEDPYCDWQKIRGTHEAGAILVRPDGYVAWRHPGAVWNKTTALQELRTALNQILSRPM